MDHRYELRREELAAAAQFDPDLLRGLLPRLGPFLQPFAQHLSRREQRDNAQGYVEGLLSGLRRKTAESIAYHHDQDRQALQKFVGQAPWDHRPLLAELARQVGAELGEPDAVLVFDPSAFPKHGAASVGVQRQWCGRLGKVENCQVGVYLAYVSRADHALVDARLYLPETWAADKTRRETAGVPAGVRFRTRHALALEMLDASGPVLPHAWVAGDDEMGRASAFRQALRDRNEQYLLAVPSNTLVRDVGATPPPYTGRGRPPVVPFARADRWRDARPEDAWAVVDVRDGEKGPLVVQVATARVQARTDRHRAGPEETLVVVRAEQSDGAWKIDYYLSNAPADTPVAEFARVTKAAHRVEECLRRAKGDAGLADYQVRTWAGWHHHQALSLIATWFLVTQTRRGKKDDPGVDRPAVGRGDRGPAEAAVGR
jgi:SRSO17 transposase